MVPDTAIVQPLLLSASFPRTKKKENDQMCIFASVVIRLHTQDLSHRDNHITSDRGAFRVINTRLIYHTQSRTFILLCRSCGGVMCGCSMRATRISGEEKF